MGITERKGLFDVYKVQIPESITDVNLIGLDFGDGDICAKIVNLIPGPNSRMKISVLYWDKEHVKQKCANVLFESDCDSAEKKLGLEGDFENGTVYSNFKRCPGGKEARSFYKIDGNKKSSYTYEQLMQESFYLAVKKLFQFNSVIDKEKRTILVVGRPSSQKWQENENEYAKLLKESLKRMPSKQPIDVVVVSEALAAFSREANPWEANGEKRREKCFKRGEIVLIIDCGSSTFDVTLVMGTGIPPKGEYSRQLGGGKIEDCMLQLSFRSEIGHTRERLVNKYDKIELRKRKEAYYGSTGTNGSSKGSYFVEFMPTDLNGAAEEEVFHINKVFMEKALNTVPVTVESSSVFIPSQTYPSWRDACKAVFTDARLHLDRYLREIPGEIPDRIIITGGASVMPEVRGIVAECFWKEPEITEFPNYSVAEGLSYVGAAEIRKNNELEATIQEVREIISNNTWDVDRIVGKYCAEGTWKQIMDSMEVWRDGEEDASLSDWFELFRKEWKSANQIKDMDGQGIYGNVHRGLIDWYTEHDLDDKIRECLRKRFENLFPDFADEFNFQIDGTKLLKEPKITIRIKYKKLFGWWHGWNPKKMRNRTNRLHCYCAAEKHKYQIINNLSGYYREQLNIREKILEEFMVPLEPKLREHVESMTPYFNMVG